MDEGDVRGCMVPLHALSYKQYRYCLEPVLELRPIERISEAALDNIIRALNESARRATELHACIDSETRAIIAMIHCLLDRPTQVLVYSLTRQVEAAGQVVTLNILAGCLVDRSQNILPEELQIEMELPVSRAESPTPSVSGASATKRARATSCPNCGQDHYLHRCESFRSLTYTQRLSVIEFHKLCRNCFMPTHLVEQCPKNGCKRCGEKHNSVLACNRPPPQGKP